jgi:RimJ/RimL family protein N-acetyltransferase
VTQPEVRIRPASAQDANAIGVLHVQCVPDLFAGLLGDYMPPPDERAERERSWTGPIGAPYERHALFVAERCERVIGFVAVGPTRDGDHDSQSIGELRSVMLAADARGLGVGQTLVAAGECAMRDDGLSTATLWVVAENSAAMRCYDRCGWRPDGSERLLEVGGHEIRAVRYRKQLAP